MKNIVAIDMGSDKTVIYQLGSGIVLAEPSVVAISPDRRRVKAVGTEAKRMVGKTVNSIEVVYPIKNGHIDDEKTATVMLENFLNKITLKKLSFRPEVLMSVPCGIENKELKKYEKVLKNVGVYDYKFVESPLLTALGIDAPVNDFNPCLIIDIGGGTSNVAAVTMDGVVAGVCADMGGKNIDALIIDFIKRSYGLTIGVQTAEKLKIQIGSLIENDNNRAIVSGLDVSTGRSRSVSISTEDLSVPISSIVDTVIDVAEMLIGKLPAEVVSEIRKTGVYLSGGTTQILGLDTYVRDRLAIKVNTSEEPEYSVAKGGGILADDKNALKRLKLNVNRK